jgi:hypothetical protein
MPTTHVELSEKQKEIIQFLEFYRGIDDLSAEDRRDIEDYIDGLTHQEAAFLQRHAAFMDWREQSTSLRDNRNGAG